jgi:hypothetical protein
MPNGLILGTYGQIAWVATDLFIKYADVRLTIYLCRAQSENSLAKETVYACWTATSWIAA